MVQGIIMIAEDEQLTEANSHTFANKRINVCLTDSNYLLWKQQVILTIRGLGLESFLDESVVDPSKLTLNEAGEQTVNPAYIRLYSKLSIAKIMALHCRLRSMKKGSQSMRDYTMAITEICDLLTTYGNPISDIDHIATILNGLLVEYEPTVVAITASKDPFALDNVVSVLIDAESRLDYSSRFPIGVNFTRYNTNQVSDAQQYKNRGTSKPNSTMRDKDASAIKPNDNVQINALMVNGPLNHAKWFPDSGATHHVTGTTSTFLSKQAYTGSGKHKRLGHPAAEVVMTTLNKRLSVDKSEVCAACHMGKSKTHPFPMSQTVYKQPFELVEVDVWGPAPIVSSGFKYFVSFVDLYSRIILSAIYLINRMPSKNLGNVSPYQKLYNKPPYYRSVVFNESIFPFAHKAATCSRSGNEPVRSRAIPVVFSLHEQARTTPRSSVHTGHKQAASSQHEQAASRMPGDIRAALKDDDSRMTVMAEYNVLISNDTWDIVELPAGRKAIGCKWLFKVKKNVNGSVERLKARLVAKGVQAKKKALYGLRQAPRNWFLKLREFLLSLRFKPSRADSSLFIRQEDREVVYMVVYVDDILITRSSQLEINQIIHALHEKFSLKDLGQLNSLISNTNKFRNDHQVKIRSKERKIIKVDWNLVRLRSGPSGQIQYIGSGKQSEKLRGARQSQSLKSQCDTPDLYSGWIRVEVLQYRSVVGALQYICHTRPDISFAVNKAAQFLQEPTEAHWLAVKRILRYLRGTLETGLWFSTQAQKLVVLNAFSDSDWGGDDDDRRSISGYCVYNGNHLLAWSSKKQRAVSRSTAEAEYRSLAYVTFEVVWIKVVLNEMNVILPEEPKVWCDNTSAIAMAAKPILHTKSKHIELDLHFVLEKVAAREVKINYVPTSSQVADILTKKFVRSRVNVKPYSVKQLVGCRLLNFNDKEITLWKHLISDANHMVLRLDHADMNVTWDSLYPEWIDGEQEEDIPCFPIPNMFPCKELVGRENNVCLYKPDFNVLREKIRLPIGSCELALPIGIKASAYSGNPSREAYATILHSAYVYVCGAIAAAQSIRMSGSTRDLVILVDEMINVFYRSGLEAAGWKVRTIQRIRNPKAEKDAYNEYNYSKFRLWQLTEYDKIIFIDADLLILRNIDFLFGMQEISATGNNATLFNSGVMVIEPSNCTFQLLMDHIEVFELYNGGDQGYLNKEDVKQKKTRLFGSDPSVLYVLHYLGIKPWSCYKDYDCNWNVDIMLEFASDVAHERWWKVHDAMPEKLQQFCLLRSKQKAQLEFDRREAEKANFSDGHWRMKVKDRRRKKCIDNVCEWESMLKHWGENNWTDDEFYVPTPPAINTASLYSL
ncbi:UDP-glucuronate:xylan alpha-glucuronosyltransferase 1 [Hibiscus syriacus]|uniref:UDP-glucuronate:xylan alpha-glucuronosyltransferase 1 n=1 Tax=Hibiscus syriacus TaxID=106335 RepID=A0A6A2WPU8_HIBSY|nr:UDP-glucuronate:xylan alpha-glucuronosyltransferase 1 [Hibiscus syriacus]